MRRSPPPTPRQTLRRRSQNIQPPPPPPLPPNFALRLRLRTFVDRASPLSLFSHSAPVHAASTRPALAYVSTYLLGPTVIRLVCTRNPLPPSWLLFNMSTMIIPPAHRTSGSGSVPSLARKKFNQKQHHQALPELAVSSPMHSTRPLTSLSRTIDSSHTSVQQQLARLTVHQSCCWSAIIRSQS